MYCRYFASINFSKFISSIGITSETLNLPKIILHIEVFMYVLFVYLVLFSFKEIIWCEKSSIPCFSNLKNSWIFLFYTKLSKYLTSQQDSYFSLTLEFVSRSLEELKPKLKVVLSSSSLSVLAVFSSSFPFEGQSNWSESRIQVFLKKRKKKRFFGFCWLFVLTGVNLHPPKIFFNLCGHTFQCRDDHLKISFSIHEPYLLWFFFHLRYSTSMI